MLVILFSPTPAHISHIEDDSYFSIDRKTKLSLNTNSKKDNFLRLIYSHESWWDEFRLPHLRKRFIDNEIILYSINLGNDTACNRRKFKIELRNNIATAKPNISARHIHIADSSREDDWIISLIESDYLPMWLEHANACGNAKSNMLLKEWMCEMHMNPSSDKLMLGGSLALYLFGLLSRFPRDVDFIFTGSELVKPIPNWNLNCHNDHLEKYLGSNWKDKLSDYPAITYKELVVCNPEFLFILKLERTRRTKLYKDTRDLFYMSLRLGKDVSIIKTSIKNSNLSNLKIFFALTEAYISLLIFPSLLRTKYLFKVYSNHFRKLRTRAFLDP